MKTLLKMINNGTVKITKKGITATGLPTIILVLGIIIYIYTM